jgi:hypothetical protein
MLHGGRENRGAGRVERAREIASTHGRRGYGGRQNTFLWVVNGGGGVTLIRVFRLRIRVSIRLSEHLPGHVAAVCRSMRRARMVGGSFCTPALRRQRTSRPDDFDERRFAGRSAKGGASQIGNSQACSRAAPIFPSGRSGWSEPCTSQIPASWERGWRRIGCLATIRSCELLPCSRLPARNRVACGTARTTITRCTVDGGASLQACERRLIASVTVPVLVATLQVGAFPLFCDLLERIRDSAVPSTTDRLDGLENWQNVVWAAIRFNNWQCHLFCVVRDSATLVVQNGATQAYSRNWAGKSLDKVETHAGRSFDQIELSHKRGASIVCR